MATQDQQRNNIQTQQPLQQVFKVKGMKTDLSESSFENEFAFENKNMRINIVDEDNTLMNLTNERGTKFVDSIQGIPIGLKKYDYNKALLFTTNNEGSFGIEKITTNEGINNIELQETNSDISIDFKDHIYKLEQQGENIKVEEIGTLIKDTNFSAVNPLEIESYKDGNKDYFYIADGINNFKSFCLQGNEITSNFDNIDNKKQQHLDYNCKIDGNESITVKSIKSSNGEFFAGTIIYCFSYITYQGHKTGIIDITNEVLAIKNYEQNYGLEPNKRANIANAITVNGLSNSFKEIEIYSLFRSTLNGEIIVRKVCELPINNRIVYFTDLNQGEIISYQELLTRFNSVLIPSTITQKSGALFLGNIKTNNYENLKELINNINRSSAITLSPTNDDFLKHNQYFYGIQLQDYYGNWSPVLYVGNSSEINKLTINKTFVNLAMLNGYIAVRAMILDNKRIRNTKCSGIILSALQIEDSKYGIDYYAPYSFDVSNNDIYKAYTIKCGGCSALYSPDIQFDENFTINSNDYAIDYYSSISSNVTHKFDVAVNGNVGILFKNSTSQIGYMDYNNQTKSYQWCDAITRYETAIRMSIDNSGDNTYKDEGNKHDTISLYEFSSVNTSFKELPSYYKIYLWQPSGSLNDSNGKTSVLKYKRISKVCNLGKLKNKISSGNTKLRIFDGTTNLIPVITKTNNTTTIYSYCGNVNQRIFPKTFTIDDKYIKNKHGNDNYWDDDQKEWVGNFASPCFDSYSLVGQPIELLVNSNYWETYKYLALSKAGLDKQKFAHPGIYVWRNTTFGKWGEWNWCPGVYSWDGIQHYSDSRDSDFVGILVTDKHNREGNINITYKTPKHLVMLRNGSFSPQFFTIRQGTDAIKIQESEIQNGQWIVCSKKVLLEKDKDKSLVVNINEKYNFDYECLLSEPYSLSDENQITCIIKCNVDSYINPYCRYDNLRNLNNYNGITSSVFNKLNMVYNQKNNFFIFSGITEDTITDDKLEHTILYSDMKLANEKEDSFVNFDTTNFYTIDNNISKINKLITYNDKLLCFSDNAISQILYNENVVVNTDSVQSLGLASTDKVTGSQLISNTFGCMNKWSMGIYNNVLFFNDDLNNKMIAYSGEFDYLNETLNIETLNSKFLKKSVWNPVYWGNTKLNIDSYAKDVHYTTNDTDIALNQTIGNFTSLYSYEKIPYMETLGDYSIAVRNLNRNKSEVYLLRQGDYNHFFGKFEPYWTTVIVNQNSLINKMISNLEFSTEAYDNNMLPVQNFTFDHIEFWNDYQSNKMAVNYKLYGQSLLKKKFRVWRINHFRNSTRMIKRNYDMMSNTWHYLKLSTENENSNKLTVHWLNVNYR